MQFRTKLLAAGLSVALAGCSAAGVAPKLSMMSGFSGEKPRTIYVKAERDRDAIAETLQQSGFQIADSEASAAYVLRVALGGTRQRGPCGTVNNVRYALDSGSATVLEIQARGWTGTCSPSVYNDMSATLANAFPASAAR